MTLVAISCDQSPNSLASPRLSTVRLCQRNFGEGLFVKSTETDIKILQSARCNGRGR